MKPARGVVGSYPTHPILSLFPPSNPLFVASPSTPKKVRKSVGRFARITSFHVRPLCVVSTCGRAVKPVAFFMCGPGFDSSTCHFSPPRESSSLISWFLSETTYVAAEVGKKRIRFRRGEAGPEWLSSRATVMVKPVGGSGATPLYLKI